VYLFGEQIRLVQEENYGDVRERFVVDDRVEDVARFYETVRATILEQNLVVLAGRCQEQNGSDAVEALIPTLAL